jgi:hypothetical protein
LKLPRKVLLKDLNRVISLINLVNDNRKRQLIFILAFFLFNLFIYTYFFTISPYFEGVLLVNGHWHALFAAIPALVFLPLGRLKEKFLHEGLRNIVLFLICSVVFTVLYGEIGQHYGLHGKLLDLFILIYLCSFSVIAMSMVAYYNMKSLGSTRSDRLFCIVHPAIALVLQILFFNAIMILFYFIGHAP